MVRLSKGAFNPGWVERLPRKRRQYFYEKLLIDLEREKIETDRVMSRMKAGK